MAKQTEPKEVTGRELLDEWLRHMVGRRRHQNHVERGLLGRGRPRPQSTVENLREP